MSAKEIIDALLRLFEIMVSCSWPVVVLLVLLLFRQQFKELLPILSKRLTKAEIAGTKWEFSEVVVSALQDAVEQGAEEYKDEPEKLVEFVREQVGKLPSMQQVGPLDGLKLVGRSILWVDDRPMNNVYEASLLKRLGASIMFARSTEEALEFLERDSYDLVISDVHRIENGRSNPDAGYELLEALLARGKKIPLIFYTGSVARLDKFRAQGAFGAADHPSQLISLVLHALAS